MRQARARGGFATIVHKGHEVAGTVFVRHLDVKRNSRLFGPAPGPGLDEEGQQRWVCVSGDEPESETDSEGRMSRYARSDPDFWLLEIEACDPEPCLDGPIVDETIVEPDPLISKTFRGP